MGMKAFLLKLIISVGVSVLVIGLLGMMVVRGGGRITPATIFETLRQASVPLVVLYAVCQLVQTVLRAIRNRVVLQAGMPEHRKASVPSLGRVTLVTVVRGACADMLPARIGELSYVAMLNRGYQIPVADCLSSLSIGLLFDFAALLVVLGVALTTLSQGLSLLGAAMVLVVVCLVGWVGLFHLMPFFSAVVSARSPARLLRWRPYAWGVKLLAELSASVRFVARSGTVVSVLGLSAAIRFVKYFGLYFLFVAVTREAWPALASARVPAVLLALIASEGAASLPVPSFMSFGSYEAGGLVALTALGFGMAASMTTMLTMHIISQAIDYSLGGAAFCAFLWTTRDAEAPVSRRGRRLRFVLVALPFVAVFLALAAGIKHLSARGPRETTAAGALAVIGGPIPLEQREAWTPPGFSGRIVWSSNRSGSHDLYQYALDSGLVTRLTDSRFTDTYPRFSPDGRRLAFSRSRIPYVSQRDPLQWDTWVMDLDSGELSRVATNAFTAVWHPDGESIVYVRNGDTLVRQRAEPDAEAVVLLAAGSDGIAAGTEFQTPCVGGPEHAIAVTLRRHHRGTWLFWPDGSRRRVGDGCQLMWTGRGPDSGHEILWVDGPGRQRSAFYAGVARGEGRTLMFDADSDWSHEYFPRTAAVGSALWMVYGASASGHEHDQADYEIFLVRLDASEPATPLRITWHTGNDCWPDLYIDDDDGVLGAI